MKCIEECGECWDCQCEEAMKQINKEDLMHDRMMQEEHDKYWAERRKLQEQEFLGKQDILVCYEEGVIETDTYEWEHLEGKYAGDQQPCGQVINLWDLKGPIYPTTATLIVWRGKRDWDIPF